MGSSTCCNSKLSALARRLTPDQRRWINWFNGDVHVVTSVEDAIRVVTKQGGVSA
jgi:hypothetical protein